MNIESKRYRLRGNVAGLLATVEIVEKASGKSAYVSSGNIPSVHALAMMPESQFNRLCADLIEGA